MAKKTKKDEEVLEMDLDQEGPSKLPLILNSLILLVVILGCGYTTYSQQQLNSNILQVGEIAANSQAEVKSAASEVLTSIDGLMNRELVAEESEEIVEMSSIQSVSMNISGQEVSFEMPADFLVESQSVSYDEDAEDPASDGDLISFQGTYQGSAIEFSFRMNPGVIGFGPTLVADIEKDGQSISLNEITAPESDEEITNSDILATIEDDNTYIWFLSNDGGLDQSDYESLFEDLVTSFTISE